MIRALSYVLVLVGLAFAWLGFYSLWKSNESERQAEEQWRIDQEQRSYIAPKQVQPMARGAHLARLSIDRLDSQWVVIEGADKPELQKGPGHLAGTALPGAPGNCVIAGHRDTQFRILRKVKMGEEIALERNGRRFLYRVVDRRIVPPTDTRSLNPTTSSTLTLVTCYPFYFVGPAPKRYIIRAELVQSAASTS